MLGALGEQPVDAAITRAKQVAASYGALVDEPVVPAFEIITTVASAVPALTATIPMSPRSRRSGPGLTLPGRRASM